MDGSLPDPQCWVGGSAHCQRARVGLLLRRLAVHQQEHALPALIVQSGKKKGVPFSGGHYTSARDSETPSLAALVLKPWSALRWLFGLTCQVPTCQAVLYIGQQRGEANLTALWGEVCNHERGTGVVAIRGANRSTLHFRARDLVDRACFMV